MANTLNYGFPKPDIVNNIDEEFYVFRDTTLDMIDAAIKAVSDAAAAKSPIGHGHAIADITGLAGELAGKMPASTTFSLDSLTDVDGAAGAAINSVLVKNSSGVWVPSSALAALGPHGHTISEITGLGDVLVSKADGAAVAAALGLKADKAVTVTGAGLATGGGDLSANRVITVTKATDAEHQARVRDDVAATPKGVGIALFAYNKWRMLEDMDLATVASYIKTDLSAFEHLRLDGEVTYSTAGTNGTVQISTDNGSNWITTGYVFNGGTSTETSSIVPGYASPTSGFVLHPNAMTSNALFPNKFLLNIGNLNKTLPKTALLLAFGVTSGSLNAVTFAGLRSNSVLAANAIRIITTAGNFSRMTFTLEGKEG